MPAPLDRYVEAMLPIDSDPRRRRDIPLPLLLATPYSAEDAKWMNDNLFPGRRELEQMSIADLEQALESTDQRELVKVTSALAARLYLAGDERWIGQADAAAEWGSGFAAALLADHYGRQLHSPDGLTQDRRIRNAYSLNTLRAVRYGNQVGIYATGSIDAGRGRWSSQDWVMAAEQVQRELTQWIEYANRYGIAVPPGGERPHPARTPGG